MSILIYFFSILSLLKLIGNEKDEPNTIYDGYIIVIVNKNNYDSYYENEYFFLPKEMRKISATRTLENHFPEIEKKIKDYGGEIFSKTILLNSKSEDFVDTMYFFCNPDERKLYKQYRLCKYANQYDIYVAKYHFTGSLQPDIINKEIKKIYILENHSLSVISSNELSEIKKILE